MAGTFKLPLGERIIMNWYNKDSDNIAESMGPKKFTAVYNNTRRRIETQIEKGISIGNEKAIVNGRHYECLWRVIRKKPKKKSNGK